MINYKTENLDEKLSEYAKDGLDIYYDKYFNIIKSVGGETLDIAIDHMKFFGAIISCGQISTYDNEDIDLIKNASMISSKRLRMHGFMGADWIPEWANVVPKIISLYVNK